MMNYCSISGRLTKDVELRKTGTGTSVAGFTLAVNRRFKKDGEQEADFISCVAWRQSADFLAQYAGKGDLIGVEGRIQTRSYDDQNGRRVYVTEVVCDSVCILSKVAQNAQNQASQNTQSSQGYTNQSQGYASNDSFMNYGGIDISSDDLPF